jgi:hypothetical protein
MKFPVNANFIGLEPGKKGGIAHPLPKYTGQPIGHSLLRSTAQNP